MPSKMVKERKLTAKQSSFVEYYCNPKSITYNNGYQSAVKAGYVKTSAIQSIVIVENSRVKVAMAVYRAKNVVQVEHNYVQALKELRLRLTYIEKAAAGGNIQAVNIQLGILKEIDYISGLHVQHIVDDTKQQRELTEAERAAAEQIAAIANRQGIKLQETA